MLIYWAETHIPQKKNLESLIVYSKENGIEVNADKN
jgi:hypothetical protein